MTLQDEFGNIDIYVFDQLLRGRIAPGMRVFDAGCGGGRNLVYLLREGFDVCGNDADPNAIAQVRALASSLSPRGTFDFRVEPIERTSFPDDHADVVISNAVLHFARDAQQFEAMLRQTWRVLKPGGVFFARLASTIGIEDQIQPDRSDQDHPCPRSAIDDHLGCEKIGSRDSTVPRFHGLVLLGTEARSPGTLVPFLV